MLYLIYYLSRTIKSEDKEADPTAAETELIPENPEDDAEIINPVQLSSSIEKIIRTARTEAASKPVFTTKYYGGGYPPDGEANSTDMIWRAFKGADILIKDLVDADIASNREAYPHIRLLDPNIDFRRVATLKIFFERNAEVLTLDLSETQEFKAGDIIVFGKNEHIGILSDKRNEQDLPYIFHHRNQDEREEDWLQYGNQSLKITGHYRYRFE